MTTEPELISRNAAEQLVARARAAAVDITERIDALYTLIQEIRDREAHKALGFRSWAALLKDIFADTPIRVDSDSRRKIVNLLVNEMQLSSRVVAPIVGVSYATVQRDAKESEPEPELEAVTDTNVSVTEDDESLTESDTPAPEPDLPTSPEPEADDDDEPLATVTRIGADGRKTTRKRTPRAPLTPVAAQMTKIKTFKKMLATVTADDIDDEVRTGLMEVQELLETMLAAPAPAPAADPEPTPLPVVAQIETEPLIMIPRVITQFAGDKSASESWIPRPDLRKAVTKSRKISVKAFDIALVTLIEKGVVIADDENDAIRVVSHHSDDRLDAPSTEPIKLFTKDLKSWPYILHYSGQPDLLTELMRVRRATAPEVIEWLDTLVIEYRLLVRSGDTWKLSVNAARVTDFQETPLRTVRAV